VIPIAKKPKPEDLEWACRGGGRANKLAAELICRAAYYHRGVEGNVYDVSRQG